jgi:hypothetical protein
MKSHPALCCSSWSSRTFSSDRRIVQDRVIRYANGETLIATCTDSAFFTQVDYFPIARNPSRVDAKHEDHSLQADFSVLISLWLGQIYFRLADKLPKRWVRL